MLLPREKITDLRSRHLKVAGVSLFFVEWWSGCHLVALAFMSWKCLRVSPIWSLKKLIMCIQSAAPRGLKIIPFLRSKQLLSPEYQEIYEKLSCLWNQPTSSRSHHPTYILQHRTSSNSTYLPFSLFHPRRVPKVPKAWPLAGCAARIPPGVDLCRCCHQHTP